MDEKEIVTEIKEKWESEELWADADKKDVWDFMRKHFDFLLDIAIEKHSIE